MMGSLYLDITQQTRYLISGVPLQLKLWPSKESIRLMSPDEGALFKIQIIDVTLFVCMAKVSSGVLIVHSNVMKESPALYPITKSLINKMLVLTKT